MANTERLMVIRLLREARLAVNDARADATGAAAARPLLERAAVRLDRLEDQLIMEEIEDRVDALVRDSRSLGRLAGDIRESTKKLAAIAAKIDRAAKAVGVLVDIAAKASSAGIA